MPTALGVKCGSAFGSRPVSRRFSSMRALTHARVVQPLCSDPGQAPNPHSNYRGPCSDVRERMHSVARAWRFCAPSGSFCSPQLANPTSPGGAPRAKPRRSDGAPGARRAPRPQRGRGRVGRLPAEMPAGDVAGPRCSGGVLLGEFTQPPGAKMLRPPPDPTPRLPRQRISSGASSARISSISLRWRLGML